jgi:hypothetical protein
MAYDNDPTAPNRSTTKTGTAKPKAKTKKPHSPAGGGGDGKYQWNGGARVHSISQKVHDQRVEAQRTLGTQNLTDPPSAAQAITEAKSAADLKYGPQVQAAQQLQANVSPWFSDYMSRVAGYARAAQQLNAPVLQQAQGYQQGAAAQLPPGLDPNSEAGQQAAQAAQGRQAIGQLGLDALNTNAQATQDYFGGQQGIAARELPQALAAAGQQVANAKSQRGEAVQGFLTDARQNAQNYAIARSTLAGNQANQANQNLIDAGYDPVTGKKQPAKPPSAGDKKTKAELDYFKEHGYWPPTGPPTAPSTAPNKYGIAADQWAHWSTSHRQRVIDKFNQKNGSSGTDDKAAAKHQGDVQAATGKVRNQITDITGYQQELIGQMGEDPSKPKVKDASGKMVPQQRKITQADVDRAKIQKYGVLAKIAIAVRDGKKLDQSEVEYLHNMDPNFRIPREWLPYDPSIQAGSRHDPKPTSGQRGGLGGK